MHPMSHLTDMILIFFETCTRKQEANLLYNFLLTASRNAYLPGQTYPGRIRFSKGNGFFHNDRINANV